MTRNALNTRRPRPMGCAPITTALSYPPGQAYPAANEAAMANIAYQYRGARPVCLRVIIAARITMRLQPIPHSPVDAPSQQCASPFGQLRGIGHTKRQPVSRRRAAPFKLGGEHILAGGQ